jgi:hypothetical protein
MWAAPFYAANLSTRVAAAQQATRARLAAIHGSVPWVATGNAQVDEFYSRSLLSVALSRLDNPTFVAVPFYLLGSQVGTATNWDFSFSAGVVAWMEPTALKGMMELFFGVGIADHSCKI